MSRSEQARAREETDHDMQNPEQDWEAQLKIYAAQIDELKCRAQTASVREKLPLYDRLEDLIIKERRVRVRLAELEDSDDQAGVANELKAAIHDLRSSLDQTGPV